VGSAIYALQFLSERLKSRSVARYQNEGVSAPRQPVADGNADATGRSRHKDRFLCWCGHLPSCTPVEITLERRKFRDRKPSAKKSKDDYAQ
jgi:hypothetical protein